MVHQRKWKVHVGLQQQQKLSVTLETTWFTSGNERSICGCNNNTMSQSQWRPRGSPAETEGPRTAAKTTPKSRWRPHGLPAEMEDPHTATPKSRWRPHGLPAEMEDPHTAATTTPCVSHSGDHVVHQRKQKVYVWLQQQQHHVSVRVETTWFTSRNGSPAETAVPRTAATTTLCVSHCRDYVVLQRKRQVHIRLQQQHHVSVTVEATWFTSETAGPLTAATTTPCVSHGRDHLVHRRERQVRPHKATTTTPCVSHGGEHVVHQRKRQVHLRLQQQHHVSVTVETTWFTSGNGRTTYGCNNNPMYQSR